MSGGFRGRGRGRGGGGFGGGGFGGGGFGGGGGGGGFGGGRGGGGGQRRRQQTDYPTDPEDEQFRKLFIGGLSYETTDESLKTHFEQWGEVVDCIVMKDPNTKRSRGFGFITYAKAAEVDLAQGSRPHKIDQREVETKRAMPRDPDGAGSSQQTVTKMFVGGITPEVTEECLKDVFCEFGDVTAVDFIVDKSTGKKKGFCFLSYNDYDCVDKAVLKKYHDIAGKKVEVKKAAAKENQGGGRGGRGGGGRGGGRGGYQQGGYGGGGGGGDGYGYGNGYQQDYSQGGGYSDYSQQQGGYGGGYNNDNWNSSESYEGGYSSGYGGGQGGGWNENFGSNYGSSYSGGPVKGAGNYSQRSSGPYGGGY